MKSEPTLGSLRNLTAPAMLGCQKILERARGLVLIAGPTGAGKSTFTAHIVAATAVLGASLRAAGDVRTAEAAVRLVTQARENFTVGVLRGGSSSESLLRLAEMSGAPLPRIAIAVVSLRLLPRLCCHCRRPVSLSVLVDGPIGTLLAAGFDVSLGCARCIHGYDGKIWLAEVLVFDRQHAGPPWSSGSLAVDGLRLVVSGAICVRDYLSFVPEADTFLADQTA